MASVKGPRHRALSDLSRSLTHDASLQCDRGGPIWACGLDLRSPLLFLSKPLCPGSPLHGTQMDLLPSIPSVASHGPWR